MTAVGVAVVAAMLVPAAASPRPVAPDAPSGDVGVALPSGSGVVVDPALGGRLAAGGAAALLAWDPAETSRAEVRAHLRDEGIDFRMFGALDMAAACMSGPADLSALTGAPGALSVWGDEVLEPALDKSVRTAFNGDPDDVWSGMGIDGEGVTIAVVDTGIDASHPDLAWHEKTLLNVKVLNSHREFLGPDNEPCIPDQVGEDEEDTEEVSGHGTHLASVAAGDGTGSDGRLRGMAPGASLFGLAALSSVDYPSAGDVQTIKPSLLRAVAAADYILLEGLEKGFVTKVALMGFTSDGLFHPFHPLSLAIQYLHQLGITVVIPAGNEGPSPSTCNAAETCHINRHSASPFTLTVGATPRLDRSSLAEFSSRGDPQPRSLFGVQYRYEPNVVAPGVDVMAAQRVGVAPYVTFPGRNKPGSSGSDLRRRMVVGYQGLTGTSVAAAHVAGTIALMQQAAVEAKGCFLTPPQVRSVLMDTATPMSGFGAHEVGAGALDATDAVWGATFAPRIDSRNPWECPG